MIHASNRCPIEARQLHDGLFHGDLSQGELVHFRLAVRFRIVREMSNVKNGGTAETETGGRAHRAHEGVILEAAEFQCGGPPKLTAAVDRGQVLKRGQPGYELYFFPKVVAGKSLSFEEKDTSIKKAEVSELEHGNFAASISSFLDGGSDALLGLAALSDTPANLTLGQSSSSNSVMLPITVLSDKKKQLDKALLIAERMQEALQKMPSLPERLTQQMVSLAGVLEKGTMFCHTVDFMLKFKKDGEGNPISAGSIAATKNKLDVQILAVVEEVKIARALLGTSKQA